MNKFDTGLAGLFSLISFACFLAGVGILGWQCYEWLRHGYWHEVNTVYALGRITEADMSSWLGTPTSWIGVHKAMMATPASGALVALSILFAWFAAALGDK